MRKVTCISEVVIDGLIFIKGCDYRVEYNPRIGIIIYTVRGCTNISKRQLDYYFF